MFHKAFRDGVRSSYHNFINASENRRRNKSLVYLTKLNFAEKYFPELCKFAAEIFGGNVLKFFCTFGKDRGERWEMSWTRELGGRLLNNCVTDLMRAPFSFLAACFLLNRLFNPLSPFFKCNVTLFSGREKKSQRFRVKLILWTKFQVQMRRGKGAWWASLSHLQLTQIFLESSIF